MPFRVIAGAPNSALILDSNGNLGLGPSSPATKLHVLESDSPTMRLEQNGTGSLPSQIWDVGGNETNFFVRDGTGGTTIPFKIRADAGNDSLVINSNSNVGIGVPSPAAALHVRRTDGTASVLVANGPPSPSAVREMFKMSNNGGSFFTLENTDAGTEWFFVHEDSVPNRFIITDGVNDGPEMTLTANGILTVEGGFVAGSTSLNVPDYVFDADYALRPLSEVASFIQENSHLPEVPSATEIADDGLNVTLMQMALLKKVEELTLYTLAQEQMIADLTARLEKLE